MYTAGGGYADEDTRRPLLVAYRGARAKRVVHRVDRCKSVHEAFVSLEASLLGGA